MSELSRQHKKDKEDFWAGIPVIRPNPGESFYAAITRTQNELAGDEKIAKLEAEIEELKGTIDSLNARIAALTL